MTNTLVKQTTFRSDSVPHHSKTITVCKHISCSIILYPLRQSAFRARVTFSTNLLRLGSWKVSGERQIEYSHNIKEFEVGTHERVDHYSPTM